MLIFPAEAANRSFSWRFTDGNFDRLAMDPAIAHCALLGSQSEQCAVWNRFYKAVPQGIQRHPEGVDGFRGRHALLRLCANRTIIYQRTIGNGRSSVIDLNRRVYKLSVAVVADAKLGDLASAAGHRALVTLGTGAGVVDGTKAFIYTVFFFKGRLIVRERVVCRLRHSVADALRSRIVRHCRSAVSGWSFFG